MEQIKYERMKRNVIEKVKKIRRVVNEAQETVKELSPTDKLFERRVADLRGFLFYIDNEIRDLGIELLLDLTEGEELIQAIQEMLKSD
jgi:hypothetical protein